MFLTRFQFLDTNLNKVSSFSNDTPKRTKSAIVRILCVTFFVSVAQFIYLCQVFFPKKGAGYFLVQGED